MKSREEEIRKLAHELYEKSGRPEGKGLEHWLEAERIVQARQKEQEAMKAEASASKKRTITRSDIRRHEPKKTGAKTAGRPKKTK